MSEITYRWLRDDEIGRLADIDRSETVRVGYVIRDGKLTANPVSWDIPGFRTEGGGEHTLAAQIRFCQGHIQNGARMVGAFVDDRMVGLGVVTPEIRPQMSQLAYLHVSLAYRRHGVASRLTREMIEHSRASGAKRMYVSATPSESAVGFYLRWGFAPTSEPIPELFAHEPEDIHMVREL